MTPVWLRIGILPPSSKADIPDHEMAERPAFGPYNPPPAAGAPARHCNALREQSIALKGSKTLLSMNQPDGSAFLQAVPFT
jgi:hypothetical protein